MKKTYLKPEAEYVSFYSEEDVTNAMPLVVGVENPSSFVGEDDNDQGWS
jgi:hypothetical protein